MSKRKPKQKVDKADSDSEASMSGGQAPNKKLPTQAFEEKENPSSGNVESDISELCSPADSKDTLRASSAHDDGEEDSGQTPGEKLPAQTIEQYQCSGNVESDIPELCTLLGIKDIPLVNAKPPASALEAVEEGSASQFKKFSAANLWFVPFLEVELENEDPLSTKNLKVSGWKVDKKTVKVLHKILPSLSKLQGLKFWQAGLKGQTVMSLLNTISLCSNVRTLVIEANPLADPIYYKIISAESVLTHLSLRCNQIGDEGARLIGLALSTTTSANKNLLSLNLAFNSIGDAGATYIARGLRLNRTLVFLSLLNNQIGDYGAKRLAEISINSIFSPLFTASCKRLGLTFLLKLTGKTLGEFALTHEEVLERRKLLLERSQAIAAAMSSLQVDSDQSPEDQLASVASSNSLSGGKQDSKAKKKEAPKKGKKPAGKENTKASKKSSDAKGSQSKASQGAQDTTETGPQDSVTIVPNQLAELMDKGHPLLDPSVQCRDGAVFMPGNTTLASLNLAGNKITSSSLDSFLKSLEMQSDGGLMRLCLERNRFTPDCGIHMLIKELLALRDPLS